MVFKVAVEVRCSVRRMKQQTSVSGCVPLQELCNVRVQIDLSPRSARLEMLATVRDVSRQAVEAIMNTPDGAEVGQKWSKVSVQVGQ
jgi:hypothetical protein